MAVTVKINSVQFDADGRIVIGFHTDSGNQTVEYPSKADLIQQVQADAVQVTEGKALSAILLNEIARDAELASLETLAGKTVVVSDPAVTFTA